jgi:hypothetical protein
MGGCFDDIHCNDHLWSKQRYRKECNQMIFRSRSYDVYSRRHRSAMMCILSFVTAKRKHSDRQVFLLTPQDMSAIRTARLLLEVIY